MSKARKGAAGTATGGTRGRGTKRGRKGARDNLSDGEGEVEEEDEEEMPGNGGDGLGFDDVEGVEQGAEQEAAPVPAGRFVRSGRQVVLPPRLRE